MTEEALERAAELLAGAANVVVSTGAGMSKESGIPTFRDAMEGLWARYSPQELATERGFRDQPARVWSWYAERRRQIAACEPHAGHLAVAELGRLLSGLAVVTQNIDGLHAAAGSEDVVELHGNINRFKCLDAGHPYAGEPLPFPDENTSEPPPACAVCGSPLRPDVVWFGEMLPPLAVERAWQLAENCDVMVVVGTSGTVWPAAELPFVARNNGGKVIEVNPEPSGVTEAAGLVIMRNAGEALPELVRRMERRLAGR